MNRSIGVLPAITRAGAHTLSGTDDHRGRIDDTYNGLGYVRYWGLIRPYAGGSVFHTSFEIRGTVSGMASFEIRVSRPDTPKMAAASPKLGPFLFRLKKNPPVSRRFSL